MIITRTPFRISFFGGGTDIPSWFLQEGGQVLSMTIDKYCYVTARHLPPFFDHSIRLAYSQLETVSCPKEIQHPLIRVILEDFASNNIEIHHDSDLPGHSGLGTSSSFGVGLTAALMGLQGKLLSSQALADRVIYYERDVLQEAGGYQDQVAAAYGGFNHIVFHTQGHYSVCPLPVQKEHLQRFQQSLLLCYVPIKRISGEISLAREFQKQKHEKKLRFISQCVDEALKLFWDGELDNLGQLMHEAWLRKREFDNVTNPFIDEVYELARCSGALGGKILGAGGGGFMLFYCPKPQQKTLRQALNKLLFVPFEFEQAGTKIIYYQV